MVTKEEEGEVERNIGKRNVKGHVGDKSNRYVRFKFRKSR